MSHSTVVEGLGKYILRLVTAGTVNNLGTVCQSLVNSKNVMGARRIRYDIPTITPKIKSLNIKYEKRRYSKDVFI